MRFSELLRNKKCKGINLHEPEQDHGDVSEDGTIVLLSGKVRIIVMLSRKVEIFVLGI